MSRIKSSNIQLGGSYILGDSQPVEQAVVKQEEEIIATAQQQAGEILNNANIQASKIIEEAQLKAQEIMQTAQEEGLKEGYKAGCEQGYQEGYNQVYTDLNNQLNSIDTFTSAVFDIKQEVLKSAEQEILQLAVIIAEKIVRQKFEHNPESILEIVKAAINALKDKEEIRIVVNPALTKHIYDFSEDLKSSIKGLKSIKIIEDKTIPPDGVIVESPDSRIDARLQTQIGEISKTIFHELRNKPSLNEIPQEIDIVINETPKKVRRGRKSD